MTTLFFNSSIQVWISALTGAAALSLVGILPLFIVPNEQNKSKYNIKYLDFLKFSDIK
jgi:hypothetical protein